MAHDDPSQPADEIESAVRGGLEGSARPRGYESVARPGTSPPDASPSDDSPLLAEGLLADIGHLKLLDILDDFRRRLIYSVVGVGLGLCVSLYFVDDLFKAWMAPLQGMLPGGLASRPSPLTG